jgi:hypothetical protein
LLDSSQKEYSLSLPEGERLLTVGNRFVGPAPGSYRWKSISMYPLTRAGTQLHGILEQDSSHVEVVLAWLRDSAGEIVTGPTEEGPFEPWIPKATRET